MSDAGGLYFGVTACHDRVPRVQRLAVYMGEALDELEKVFVKGTRVRAAKTGKRKPPATGKRTARRAVARKG
jgi:hypothetical protein